MRTKTLLLAAAAFAAGLTVSSADPVYSQNVVGYVNLPMTNGVFSVVAPALDLDGTGVNNTVASLFPNPAINDKVYVFNGAGYDILSYIVQQSGHSPNYTYATNWFDALGAIAPNYPINPGQAAFYLPATNETATITGVVLQGTNLVNTYFPAAGNFQLLSSIFPIAGGLTSVLGYQPTINDIVYIYDNGQYDIYSYIVQQSGHSPNYTYATNWFNALGVVQEPVINVGQGFWIRPGGSSSWSQNLTVQ
jgi:hypothetical protein